MVTRAFPTAPVPAGEPSRWRRLLLVGPLAIAMALGAAVSPAAAKYPEKPIRIVVPLAAGGTTDVIARILAETLTPILGQQVLVENRTGASGQIAVDYVSRAAPDGYTLLLTTLGTVILPVTNAGFKRETLDKLEAIAKLEGRPASVIVSTQVPVKSFKELIDYAKANPGKLHYGAQGASDVLGIGQLAANAGIDVVTVRYQGGAPAMQAVAGNQVQFTFGTAGAVKALTDAGTALLVATTGTQRDAATPDVPTVSETVPGYEFISWTGLSAPVGIPHEAVERLSAAVKEALASPKLIEKFAQQGTVPEPSSPAEFAKFFNDEIAKWAKIADDTGFKPQ